MPMIRPDVLLFSTLDYRKSDVLYLDMGHLADKVALPNPIRKTLNGFELDLKALADLCECLAEQ